MLSRRNDELLISYMNLRRTIGVLGVALPLTVMLGGLIGHYSIQGSVSAYYYTNMRDFFVGLLALTGAFLLCYRGFNRVDDWATNFSGVCALGIATFPMDCGHLASVSCDSKVGTFRLPPCTSNALHFASAALFFISSALICLLLFTKTDQAFPTREKKRRNAIYRFCGWGMLATLAIFAVHLLPALSRKPPVRLTLFVEIVCLALFGISWLTKGEIGPLRDKGETENRAHDVKASAHRPIG